MILAMKIINLLLISGLFSIDLYQIKTKKYRVSSILLLVLRYGIENHFHLSLIIMKQILF